MFLQIHYLVSYPATLLNRDDTGLAKRMPFGGTPRIRISSQSQKRHWRIWIRQQLQEKGSTITSGWRSRYFFSRVLVPRLEKELEKEGETSQERAEALVQALVEHLFQHSNSKNEKKKKNQDTLNALDLDQGVLFGQAEADYFITVLREAADKGDVQNVLKERLPKPGKRGSPENSNNLAALVRTAGEGNFPFGFEGALFGRFITSDVAGTRMDAPVHVAHAFTTHAEQSEMDYFTLVDDLASAEETGAAHLNETELTTGVYYGYVVVDIPQLVSNITGCDPKDWRDGPAEEARTLLELLIQAIATVTPGAKLGATAPYARAHTVILETGTTQPRTLANAFLQPVHATETDDTLADASLRALAQHLTRLEEMYGPEDLRRWIATLSPKEWPRQSDREWRLALPDAIAAALHTIWPTPDEADRA